MTGLAVKKRPLAGSATSRVWEIADEMLRLGGEIPSGRAVVDRYVAEGFNEGTGFTQYSHWKKAHEHHFKRGTRVAEPTAKTQTADTAETNRPAFSSTERQTLKVGSDGRLLIPQEMRSAMRLDAHGQVVAWVENGMLRVQSPAVGIAKMQAMARDILKPGTNLVDAFLAERRAMWGDE